MAKEKNYELFSDKRRIQPMVSCDAGRRSWILLLRVHHYSDSRWISRTSVWWKNGFCCRRFWWGNTENNGNIGDSGTAVFTLLTPPMAKAGYIPLIVARFLEGLFEVVILPEKSIYSCFSGSDVPRNACNVESLGSGARENKTGNFRIFWIVLWNCHFHASLGLYWRTIWMAVHLLFLRFVVKTQRTLVLGLIALAWCYFWMKRVQDYPAMDPDITTDELTLLQRDAVNQNIYVGSNNKKLWPLWVSCEITKSIKNVGCSLLQRQCRGGDSLENLATQRCAAML